MKVYEVYVNSVGYKIKASSKFSAMRQGYNAYCYSPQASDTTRKARRADPIGSEMTIRVKRVQP